MRKLIILMVLFSTNVQANIICSQALNIIENKKNFGPTNAWLANSKAICYNKTYLIYHNSKLSIKKKNDLCNEILKKLDDGLFIISNDCTTIN
jgi:hypothetical protein